MKTFLFPLSIFLFAAPLISHAEISKGMLKGKTIHVVTKEPVVGANVSIVGTTLGAATNQDGVFEITGIPVGAYQLRISQVGFEPLTKTDVIISSGKPKELIFELTESLIEFSSVTVTAGYFQKNIDNIVSVQTQGAEEIRRLPGGLEDVVRAVSILPGVAQVQAGRNDLIVRGGSPSENLFIVDNIEVPNINHFGTQGATGGPTSFINLDYVSETEFSTGGFGARYGDKLSSVLTISLKDGRTDRIGGKATISASQFGASAEGPLGNGGSFVASARRSYLDFIFKAAGFAFVPEYWDFLVKVKYPVSKNDEISVLSISAINNVRQFNETREKQFSNSRILASSQYQGIAGAAWRHLFNGGFTNVTLGTTYVKYNTEQRDTAQNPIFSNLSYEREYSLRGEMVYLFSTHTELTIGAQSKIAPFSSEMILRPFIDDFGEPFSFSSNYRSTGYKSGVYGQVSHTFDRLRITLGGRLDYFSMIKDKIAGAPRLSATYGLTDITNLNASIGKYHQAPSYIWLVSNPDNNKLRFLSVDQYVFGIDHLLRNDVKISLEGYYKHYYDYPASIDRTYLIMANTGGGFGGAEEGFASYGIDRLVSSGAGSARGVELFLQKKSSDVPHYAIVSISYNVSEFTAMDGISRPSNFDQRLILNLGGGYIFNERYEFSAKFRLATGRPYTPLNPDGSRNIAGYNTARVVTNHSIDIRIDRRWNFGGWNLVAYLDVQNLYNRKPTDVPRYNPYTKQIEDNSAIGILPSIGVTAEF